MDGEGTNRMKKLLIVRGCSGSGKNFLVDTILEDTFKAYCRVAETGIDEPLISFEIFSTDDLFEIDGRYCWNPEYLRLFHQANLARAKLAMNNGIELVIINNTNTTFKEFSDYVEHAILHEYEIEIREPETSWKYDVEECFKRNTHGVPKEVIQKMLDRWESTESCLQKVKRIEGDIWTNVKN